MRNHVIPLADLVSKDGEIERSTIAAIRITSEMASMKAPGQVPSNLDGIHSSSIPDDLGSNLRILVVHARWQIPCSKGLIADGIRK